MFISCKPYGQISLLTALVVKMPEGGRYNLSEIQLDAEIPRECKGCLKCEIRDEKCAIVVQKSKMIKEVLQDKIKCVVI